MVLALDLVDCWLSHLTRKIVPEMTDIVSNGTIDRTTCIP